MSDMKRGRRKKRKPDPVAGSPGLQMASKLVEGGPEPILLERAPVKIDGQVKVAADGRLGVRAADNDDDDASQVLSFFSLHGLRNALRVTNYSVAREMEILVEIAEDRQQDAMSRMGAVKLLRDHLWKAVVVSGGVQEVLAKQDFELPNGRRMTAEVSGIRVSGLANDTENLLKAGLGTMEVLNATAKNTRIPERDYGGGGLCEESQKKAQQARWADRERRRHEDMAWRGELGEEDVRGADSGVEMDLSAVDGDGGTEDLGGDGRDAVIDVAVRAEEVL